MARTSSDPSAGGARGDVPVFVAASDRRFGDAALAGCARAPSVTARYDGIAPLVSALGELERLGLAFVVVAEPDGGSIDIHALRDLRIDFPQVVVFALLGECDERTAMRLQTVGVHGVLVAPFSEVDLPAEFAAVAPNAPRFKRHPDLMRRGQARLDFLIPSDLTYVVGINHEVSLLLREFGFPPRDTRVNIPLACDEAITNAIVHGNGSDPARRVNVQIYVSHSRFRMRVRDEGGGFDVEALEDPRAGDNVLRSGGRGVFLMRRIMDSVEYRDGGREVVLEKRNPLAPGTGEGGGGGESSAS